MARHVTGSSNSFLSLSAPAVSYPYTLSLRFKADSVAASAIVVTYGQAITTWDADYLSIASTGATAASGKALTFVGSSNVGTIGANDWHLGVVVFESASKRTIYLDNAAQTATGTDVTPVPGLDPKYLTIGGVLVSGIYPPFAFDGNVADVAMWHTALTSAEVTQLATGVPPDAIQASSILGYWRLLQAGGLESNAGTLPDLTANGTVPATADPPALSAKITTLLSNSYRDYLPGSRIGSPALDDPLSRNLTASLPMTETYTQQIADVQNGAVFTVPPVTDTYFRWDADGGINRSFTNYSLELEALWNNPGIGYVVPLPPLSFSLWAKSFYIDGTIFHMGVYGYHTGLKLRSDAPDGIVRVHRFASAANDLVSDVPSTSIMRQDTWAHITVTLSADLTLKLYFNGRLEGQHQSATPQAAMSRARLFLANTEGETFYGGVRDLRVWNTEITAGQVLELYARGYRKNAGEYIAARSFPLIFDVPPAPPVPLSKVSGTPLVRGIGTAATGAGIGVALSGVQTTTETVKGITQRSTSVAMSGVQGAAAVYGIGFASTGASARALANAPTVALVRGIGIMPTGTSTGGQVARVTGLAYVGGIGANKLVQGFHSSLGSILYPAVLDREKQILFGKGATATFYSMTRSGETVLIELKNGWSARRIPTIESGADEQWRVEVTSMDMTWAMVQTIATVEIFAATTQETQRYRVLQVENAMKPGHVYLLRCEAIEQK